MRTILSRIHDRLSAGDALVLVTITAASGATPRGAGAHMLVSEEGRICGTIGGGAVEYRAQELAKQMLQEKTSGSRNFSLNRDDVQNLGMICGGNVEVFFHYLSAHDPKILALTQEAEAMFAQDNAFWMVCDIGNGGHLQLYRRENCPDWMLSSLTGKPQRLQRDGLDLFIEQLHVPGRVYIFGGGHVAQELEPVLSHIGFRCVVLEDREEFAKKSLFPSAEDVRLIDFTRISDFVTISEQDYVCVMTRGHAHDTVIQAQILRQTPCYCGVIGSRSKAAGVRKALLEEHGLTEQECDRITTPIGLPIQAETPEEIAISIAAQMISVRAARKKM